MQSHSHDDHHHHGPVALTRINQALIIGAVINTVYVLVEFGAGFYYGSLSLVADAGHNLSDVASLLLSLLAFWLAKAQSTPTYTYGYRKSTVLASLTNGVLLMVTIGAIVWESFLRLREATSNQAQPIAGNAVAWVAALGILVNIGSALLFYRDKDHDLNTKGAYLHLAVDALVSLGVVVSGLLMRYTGWYWLDAVTGLLVAGVIFGSAWRLLADSVRLSLDGVPGDIDLATVQTEMRKVSGILDVHHVHVWAMSTTENALTAHLVLAPNLTNAEETALKRDVRHRLEHLNINHITLEVESGSTDCQAVAC